MATGNPSWGAGYHKGYDEGFDEGSIAGVIVGVGLSGAVALAAWGIPKIRDSRAAKHLKRLADRRSLPPGEDETGDAPSTE